MSNIGPIGWIIILFSVVVFCKSNFPRVIASKIEGLLAFILAFTKKMIEEQKAKKAAASKGEVPEDYTHSNRMDDLEESLQVARRQIEEIWENGQGSWKEIGDRLEHESARTGAIEGRLQDIELLLHNVANSVSLMAKGENPPASAAVTNENVAGEEVFLMPGEPTEE